MNKTVKLYEGGITLHFSDTARNRYTIEETGSSPVGVTTVLQTLNKPALMTWPMNEALGYLQKITPPLTPEDYENASKAYLLKSDRGKDTGTEIHAMIEEYLGTLDGERAGVEVGGRSVEAIKAFESFRTWFKSLPNVKVLATEQIIYSKKYDFAGTYDCLLEIDGKVVLVDWKTTNASRTAPLGVYPEMFMQLGAYSLASMEEAPMEVIDEVMVGRVGKDGVVNILRASDVGLSIKQCQDAFIATIQAYRFLTPLSKELAERKK